MINTLAHVNAGRSLLELGLPRFEIVLLRRNLSVTEMQDALSHLIGVEISGDIDDVLGNKLASAACKSITLE